MKIRSLILLIVFFFCGCEPQAVVIVPEPKAATLTAPAQNEVCTTGTNISDTQSLVLLKWLSADNTDLYEIHLKNLSGGQIQILTTAKKELELSLLRNTPYSWFIVSKSTKTNATAQSSTWKFYNSGNGTISYAPFPAELLSPGMGQEVNSSNGFINLTWKGTDVDNDISGFDVYVGTGSNPSLYRANIKESLLGNINVNSNVVYYWRVITRDSKGNTSDSGVYQFKVK